MVKRGYEPLLYHEQNAFKKGCIFLTPFITDQRTTVIHINVVFLIKLIFIALEISSG